jgi:hypothetical protein
MVHLFETVAYSKAVTAPQDVDLLIGNMRWLSPSASWRAIPVYGFLLLEFPSTLSFV